MIYLLIILTMIFLCFVFIFNRKKFFSVTTIVTIIFLLTEIVSLFAIEYFKVDIKIETVSIIIFSLLFLYLGELLANNICKGKEIRQYSLEEHKEIIIPAYQTLIVTLFILGVAYYVFKSILDYALTMNITGSISSIFNELRNGITNGRYVYTAGILESQLQVLTSALAYFYCYVFLNNAIFCSKIKILQLLPIISECIVILPSTARINYIKLITVFFAIFTLMILQKKSWNYSANKKIVRIALICFIVFIMIFWGAGFLTKKSSNYTFTETMYKYIGAGIYGLDESIYTSYPDDYIWAQKTFYNLRMIINHLFGAELKLGNQFTPTTYISATGKATVMHTGLYIPLKEFGLIYLFITRFLIGYIYTSLINKFKYNKKSLGMYSYILFGFIFYPIIMMPLDDVFPSYVGYSILYYLFYLIIIKWFFIDHRVIKIKK